jgi:hypothetical protein
LLQDRGRRGGDSKPRSLADRHPCHRVVARIVERYKASRQGRAYHLHPQPAMRQRLVVIGDDLVVDPRA